MELPSSFAHALFDNSTVLHRLKAAQWGMNRLEKIIIKDNFSRWHNRTARAIAKEANPST